MCTVGGQCVVYCGKAVCVCTVGGQCVVYCGRAVCVCTVGGQCVCVLWEGSMCVCTDHGVCNDAPQVFAATAEMRRQQ